MMIHSSFVAPSPKAPVKTPTGLSVTAVLPQRSKASHALREDMRTLQRDRRNGTLSYGESMKLLDRMFREAHRAVPAAELDDTVVLLTKTLQALVHPGDHAKILRRFAMLLRKGEIPASYRVTSTLRRHVEKLDAPARMHIGEIPEFRGRHADIADISPS